MEHEPPVSGFGVAADAPALRVDYGLSRESPLYADSNFFEEAMPLEVHVHGGIEFGVLLSGEQERRFENLVYQVGPGDVWLSATWEPHGFRIVEPGSADVVVMFLPEFLGEEQLGELSWVSLFAASPAERPRVGDDKTRQKMLAIGREMQREIAGREAGWASAVRLDLLKALLTLSRAWEPPSRSHRHATVRASNLPRIMPALVLVHAERGRRVAVAEAASRCGLGRAQFSLVFRDTMGMSFGRFCLRSRLGFVAEMLLSTDLPTQAIAQRAGFVDGSHMHRAFVARYGCTPGQYRSDNRPT